MSKTNKESFFWTSYSDLMTSMFFVMLILFVFMVVLFQNQPNCIELEKENQVLRKKLEETQVKILATQQELKKIKEIEESVKNIDSDYFEYDSLYKRHTLKDIEISFERGSSDIINIPLAERTKLLQVGRSIQDFAANTVKTNPNVKYLLIVEGQSSKDNYPLNYELSYERALALVKYWNRNDIHFDANHCEVIISGSGQESPFRVQPDTATNARNQRFVIHIIPKPGIIESSITPNSNRR
jgi:outer membrane protein OmpA-like peptidoglycan-associated protein